MIKYQQLLTEIIKGKTKWAEFKAELSEYNIDDRTEGLKDTSAGKIFEVFTKYYFLTAPEHIGQYENVWLYDEIPLKVKEKLDLGSIEKGMDLLLETTVKDYVKVSCKFTNDENTNLSWNKFSNLFSFCPKVDTPLVFSNFQKCDNTAIDQYKNFTFMGIGDLLEIEPSTFANITSLLNDEKPKEKQHFIPKDHQREAIDKCIQRFNEGESRGQLILPCGAGKTLTALWIKEELKCNTTLVLVPSLALLRQTKNEWAKQRKTSYQYLCVCSEKTIDIENDSIATRTYEIGGKVTTNPSEIISFLNRDNQERVIFSTYQSLPEIIKSLKGTDLNFDLVFCDEAHKTAGGEKGVFGLIHDNEEIPAKRRLYATATPRIIKESHKKKLEDDLKFSHNMGDATTYGEEFYRMSFKDAIEKDILVDYKIIAIGVSDSKLASYINERRYVDKKVSIDEVANNYALDYVMKEYKANHALTFHSRVKLAETFSKRHSQLVETTSSFSVNGTQSTSVRNQILNEFKKAEKAVISNARCLIEGVDIPTIDLVYFSDPKNSKVDIIQAVGRALRKKIGKALGYVVVPIYHTDDEDLENSIKQSSFKNLIQVIRSLCDQDERLQDEINSIAFGKGRRNSNRIDVISNESDAIQLIGFKERLKQALFDQVIEKISDNWEVNYMKLKLYLEQNNNRYPKDAEHKFLHQWISNQRNLYQAGKLSSMRIKKLEDINFIWSIYDNNWFENFNKAKKNRERGKDDDDTVKRWIAWQRHLYGKNKLEAEKIELLTSIGLSFSPYLNTWIKNKNEFNKRINDSEIGWPLVVNKHDKLSRWAVNQKKLQKLPKTPQNEYYINELNKINFPWKIKWDFFYDLVKKIVDEKKYFPLDSDFPSQIRPWLVTQRDTFKFGQLDPKQTNNENDKNRLNKLNRIGFIWDKRLHKQKLIFNSNIKVILEFKKKNKNWPKPKKGDLQQTKAYKNLNEVKNKFLRNELKSWQKNILEDKTNKVLFSYLLSQTKHLLTKRV